MPDMEFLADLLFELVGEAVIALGWHAFGKLFRRAADLKNNFVQTLFSRHLLD